MKVVTAIVHNNVVVISGIHWHRRKDAYLD